MSQPVFEFWVNFLVIYFHSSSWEGGGLFIHQTLLTSAARVTISWNSPEDQKSAAAVDGLVHWNKYGECHWKNKSYARYWDFQRPKKQTFPTFALLLWHGNRRRHCHFWMPGLFVQTGLSQRDTHFWDLCDLLPMANTVRKSNWQERKALECQKTACHNPAMEGRFPCVDGVKFAFGPSKPSGSRIVDGSV
jgi:hypothetical protein